MTEPFVPKPSVNCDTEDVRPLSTSCLWRKQWPRASPRPLSSWPLVKTPARGYAIEATAARPRRRRDESLLDGVEDDARRRRGVHHAVYATVPRGRHLLHRRRADERRLPRVHIAHDRDPELDEAGTTI